MAVLICIPLVFCRWHTLIVVLIFVSVFLYPVHGYDNGDHWAVDNIISGAEEHKTAIRDMATSPVVSTKYVIMTNIDENDIGDVVKSRNIDSNEAEVGHRRGNEDIFTSVSFIGTAVGLTKTSVTSTSMLKSCAAVTLMLATTTSTYRWR